MGLGAIDGVSQSVQGRLGLLLAHDTGRLLLSDHELVLQLVGKVKVNLVRLACLPHIVR